MPGLIWLQESVIWMHAVVFMMGAAYTLQQEDHVRVDVFYRAMSDRRRAWVDLRGVIIFLWPLCAFLGMEVVRFRGGVLESARGVAGIRWPAVSADSAAEVGAAVDARCSGTAGRLTAAALASVPAAAADHGVGGGAAVRCGYCRAAGRLSGGVHAGRHRADFCRLRRAWRQLQRSVVVTVCRIVFSAS